MTIENAPERIAEPRQQVVVWSGGADSTMLLTERAWKASKSVPVIAITIESHPQVRIKQLDSQKNAQKNYLAWAKEQGLPIQHARIKVSWVPSSGTGVGDGVSQAMLWLAHITPYLPKRCCVAFGYIAGDAMWHRRHEHEAVLLAMQNLSGSDWEIDYAYEWSSKGKILHALEGWKVPDKCWWTCEEPKRVGVACGSCAKCRELNVGRLEATSLRALALKAQSKRGRKSV